MGPTLIRMVPLRRTPTQTDLGLLHGGGAGSCRLLLPPCPLLPTWGLFVKICFLHSQPPENVWACPAPARTWGGGSVKPSGTPLSLQKASQLCMFPGKMERGQYEDLPASQFPQLGREALLSSLHFVLYFITFQSD